MRPENSLRHRLVAAYVLLAVVIGGVFAAAAYVIVEIVEYERFEVRLSRAGNLLVQAHRVGMTAPPSLDLRFEVDDKIPQEMRALPAGLHQIEANERVFQVLITIQDGHRFAVIDDVTEFEQIEFMSVVALSVTFVAGVLLALALARLSVNRIVAPLSKLTSAVQRDTLPDHRDLLAAGDEIGLLARAFRDSSARESLFTADMSHELRTPLTVILGAAELLSGRLSRNPDLHEIAERIRRTADLTSRRVSALLQLSRHPGTIPHGPLALTALLEQEIERCRPLLAGKPVALTLDSREEVWAHGAHDLAAIAVGNLLQNACNFTQNGAVRVALKPGSLVIEDTGPGIPQAVRARLFEPFVKGADDTSMGWGLGLSIVKRVTDHLGWTIVLDDGYQGGSRFKLTFSSSPPI